MMVRYRERARDDIEKIYDRIARDSEASAERVENAICRAVGMLRMEPEMGADMGYEETRRWPMRDYKYTIFYRIQWVEEFIDVLRIVDSAGVRNLKRVPRAL